MAQHAGRGEESEYEFAMNHLTMRSSQPLTAPMFSFPMTSTLNPAAELVAFSGG